MLALVPLLLTLAAPPGGATIEGTVRDQGGTPLAGAVIVVDGRLPGARSDARGQYRLEAIPAGRHVLRATLAGYQPYERVDLVLKEGTRVVEDIVLAALPATSPVAAVQEAKDEAMKTYRHAPGSPATTQANGGFFRPPHDTEDYHHFSDNRFLTVGANPLSTFAIDVDAASYANVRRFLTEGRMPPADAVRVEELINYFPYDYPAPTGEHPFSVTTAQMPAPWAKVSLR